ncbi:MAG: hypothetical protein EB053_05910, partial [Chlamydiae bacterium]|nr:hypothetical protein [Chlamydiota bacterium]
MLLVAATICFEVNPHKSCSLDSLDTPTKKRGKCSVEFSSPKQGISLQAYFVTCTLIGFFFLKDQKRNLCTPSTSV